MSPLVLISAALIFLSNLAHADCNDLMSLSPASRARNVMARGLIQNWTINDYHQTRIAILPDGRNAWAQLARVLWEGPFGQRALTIRSMAFSKPEYHPTDIFMRGERLDDFIKMIQGHLNFVLKSYARRRKWPTQFLDQLRKAAFDYADESDYITSGAGEISQTIGMNTGTDMFLKPFYGTIIDTATIRLAAEHDGKTIMESLLDIEIPTDSDTLKVEPGNLNILPMASEPAKAQLAVGILASMNAMKAKFRKSHLKFITYTDDHALPIYKELGFRKVKTDFFKGLKLNSFEVDKEGFVTLVQRFPDGTVLTWTPLSCEESNLKETAWKFIKEFQQKYGFESVKKDLNLLVGELVKTLKVTPEITSTVFSDYLTRESYSTHMISTPSMLGFKTRAGTFRGIRQTIPHLEQGEIVRFGMTDDRGKRCVGQLTFDDGILKLTVYPWHDFKEHDWGVPRLLDANVGPWPVLWQFRAGSFRKFSSGLPQWMEYLEYDDKGYIVRNEGTWLDDVVATKILNAPLRLSSLILNTPSAPE